VKEAQERVTKMRSHKNSRGFQEMTLDSFADIKDPMQEMKEEAALDKRVLLELESSEDEYPEDATEFVRKAAEKGGLAGVLNGLRRLNYLEGKRQEKIAKIKAQEQERLEKIKATLK